MKMILILLTMFVLCSLIVIANNEDTQFLNGGDEETYFGHWGSVEINEFNTAYSDDVTPPGTVTDLTNISSTRKSITWNWTNPADSDFWYSIIYIDGDYTTTTSGSQYTATGLSPATDYTITLNTVDFVGNINTTNVSNTAQTLNYTAGGFTFIDTNKKTVYVRSEYILYFQSPTVHVRQGNESNFE